VLFAAFLAAAPCPCFGQLPSQWSDAVHSLAEKIAAAAVPSRSLALSMTNTSSLSGADSSAIYDSLLADLRSRGFVIASSATTSSEEAQVRLTLSEGADGCVWVAEIRRNAENSGQVEMVAAPRLSDSQPGNGGKSVALSRRMVWQQHGEILDFAILPAAEPAGPDAPGAIGLVILEPERLVFYASQGSQWQLDRAVPIPHAAPWPRDLTGQIDLTAGKAVLPGMNCEGDFEHLETWRCAATHKATASVAVADQEQLEIDGHPADFVPLGKVCDALGPILLVTGTGDWTQPDRIRAYETDRGSPVALGQAIEFSGPILAHAPAQDGKSARVVSRNLETGTYEASIVSVSCGD
jgi:hypothetical protein